MKLIAGLGNPGRKYAHNRHNLGFVVIDEFCRGLVWRNERDLVSLVAKDRQFVAVKPTTFMNLSGAAVGNVCNFYKIKSKDVLVVCDDVDLEFGKIRLAFDGSSAGHNGVDSIIKSLSTHDFNRLRIGIGRPKAGKVEDFVLSDFSKEEKGLLKGVLLGAVTAINAFLSEGINATMNRFN